MSQPTPLGLDAPLYLPQAGSFLYGTISSHKVSLMTTRPTLHTAAPPSQAALGKLLGKQQSVYLKGTEKHLALYQQTPEATDLGRCEGKPRFPTGPQLLRLPRSYSKPLIMSYK